MGLDQDKWTSPASNGDVARALIECRLSMNDIYAAFMLWSHGRLDEANRRMESFVERDKRLHDLINEIGGLGDHAS